MSTSKASDKIARYTKHRESLKQQVAEANKKIAQYNEKISKEIGELAIAHHLNKLPHDELVAAFEKIAKERNLK